MSFSCDRHGRTTDLDKAFTDLTGIDLAGGSSYRWIDHIHPDDVDCYLRTFHKAMGAGRPYRATARFRIRSGVYVPMTVQMSPRLDRKGRISHWTGVVTVPPAALLPGQLTGTAD